MHRFFFGAVEEGSGKHRIRDSKRLRTLGLGGQLARENGFFEGMALEKFRGPAFLAQAATKVQGSVCVGLFLACQASSCSLGIDTTCRLWWSLSALPAIRCGECGAL